MKKWIAVIITISVLSLGCIVEGLVISNVIMQKRLQKIEGNNKHYAVYQKQLQKELQEIQELNQRILLINNTDIAHKQLDILINNYKPKQKLINNWKDYGNYPIDVYNIDFLYRNTNDYNGIEYRKTVVYSYILLCIKLKYRANYIYIE